MTAKYKNMPQPVSGGGINAIEPRNKAVPVIVVRIKLIMNFIRSLYIVLFCVLSVQKIPFSLEQTLLKSD